MEKRITSFLVEDHTHAAWQTLTAAVRAAGFGNVSEGDLLRGLVNAATQAFEEAGGDFDPRGAVRAIYPFTLTSGAAAPLLRVAEDPPAAKVSAAEQAARLRQKHAAGLAAKDKARAAHK